MKVLSGFVASMLVGEGLLCYLVETLKKTENEGGELSKGYVVKIFTTFVSYMQSIS